MQTPAKWQEKANSWNKPKSSGKKIDAEGHKIINELITADTERTVWQETTEPVHRKERRKNDQSDI